EIVVIVEIERQGLIDAHRRKVSTRLLVLQSKDIREKASRSLFITSRHDGVIQNDSHDLAATHTWIHFRPCFIQPVATYFCLSTHRTLPPGALNQAISCPFPLAMPLASAL